MTTIAWFHCFAGIAGDMALGSVIDAGADVGEIVAMLGRLAVNGWTLDAEPVLRGGVAATHVVVHTKDDDAVVRTHTHIAGVIGQAGLPTRVRDRALAVFANLAA